MELDQRFLLIKINTILSCLFVLVLFTDMEHGGLYLMLGLNFFFSSVALTMEVFRFFNKWKFGPHIENLIYYALVFFCYWELGYLRFFHF